MNGSINKRFMALWLEGPMQSWGFESKFGYRTTAEFPTKSGLIGLILCALGKAGAQREMLAELSPCPMTVVRYSFLGAADSPVVSAHLTDFHMVGAGYDESDSWQKLFQPKTADGASGSGAYITYRDYLQDEAFGIIFEVSSVQDDAISSALKTPVWDIYLGRKSCAPTEIIYQGSYDDNDNCLERLEDLSVLKNRVKTLLVCEGENDDGEHVILNDVPVCFGQVKEYRDRVVTIVRDFDGQ
jgi:CRISPR system Cascade subunit CasD